MKRYRLNARYKGGDTIRTGYEDVVEVGDDTPREDVVQAYVAWIDDPAIVASADDVDIVAEAE